MSVQVKDVYLQHEADSVKLPYIVLGAIILVVAAFFYFTKLPDIKQEQETGEKRNIFHALSHRHLAWAVVAQFFYVGAQVCVSSFFILIATKAANINEKV